MFLLGETANPYLILFSYFMKVKPLSPPPTPPPPILWKGIGSATVLEVYKLFGYKMNIIVSYVSTNFWLFKTRIKNLIWTLKGTEMASNIFTNIEAWNQNWNNHW